MADLFRGKLKALGDGIEKVGTVLKQEVVTSVVSGAQTVGTGVISLAKDIKDGILDSDLDRIRSVHQFQKQQQANASFRRKQVSEKELDAADQRADVVMGRMPPQYFDQQYDPVRHELSQLKEDSGQDDIDQIVDRLGTCMEAVSGKLSRHVMKKRDQLIVGIDVVASIEDDLKTALSMSRSGRASVRQAGDEVQRHLRVSGQTRRKQGYMQLMEVLAKIKQARDLQRLLRRAQEGGEYHTAILLCVQCFQGIQSLKELRVSSELLSTVQRLYVDTLHKLDGALTAICAEFDAGRYAKVLDAYMLQGTAPPLLAERVLQSFKDALNDATARAIKALLLTQPQLVSRLAGGSSGLEGSFATLCGALPYTLLPAALTQVMEVCLSCLASYYTMLLWHRECLAANTQQQQGEGEGPGDEAQNATLAILGAVADMLASSHAEVFTAALNRVLVLVKLPAATSGPNLLQVSEHCSRFVSLGEAFCGCELGGLRDQLGALLATAFEAYHHANMQTLSTLMQGEDAWRNTGGPCLAHEVPEGSLLRLQQLMVPPRSMDGTACQSGTHQQDFMSLIENGSPFLTPAPPPTLTLPNPGAQNGSANSIAASTPATTTTIAPLIPLDTTAAAAAGNREQQAVPDGARGVERAAEGLQGAGQGAATAPMLTPAARHVLGCLKAYCQLFKGVGRARAGTVWEAVMQLLDRFLVATFMLLSGISVELLVLRDDVVTFRLQRVLLRILSADGSRYKAQIEELQRMKASQTGGRSPSSSPAPLATTYSSSSTGISWLDRFGDRMESLANDFDRSVAKLSMAVADKVPGLDAVSAMNAALGNSLQERVVAGESLAAVAGELRAARSAILSVLHGASAAVQSGAITPRQPTTPVALSPAGPMPNSNAHQTTDSYGFTAVTPPPSSGAVRLQYQGMQNVLAHQQQPPNHQPTDPASSGGGPRLQYQGMQGVMQAGQQQQSYSRQASNGGAASSPAHHSGSYHGGTQSQLAHASGAQYYYSGEAGENLGQVPGGAGVPPMRVTSATTAREAEAYYSRVVEAAFDLREALLQGGARALLGRVLDPDRGVAAAIQAVAAYAGRDPPVHHNAWADSVAASLKAFAAALATRADLPQPVIDQLWVSAMGLVSDALTSGFSRVRKCTLEGRAAMSMDLSAVERVVRGLLPPGASAAGLAALKRTDAYVRALYLPWDEFSRWCQLHFAEVGMWRLLPLIDQAADVHRAPKRDKQQLLDLLASLSHDF